MPRQFKIIVLVNLALIILFCYFNWANWILLNGENLNIISEWSPFWITVYPTEVFGREIVMFPNYPFMLFWLSTITNLYFLRKIQKSKETNPV